jgi:hypothetical protein
MEDLQTQYARKYQEYEDLIQRGSIDDVSKIKKLNLDMSNILRKMMETLASVEEDTGHIEQYRRDLNQKIADVQNEYSAILVKKDALQTLRGIRQHQQATFSGAFFWYSIALFFAASLFFILIVYKMDAKPVIKSSPATIPPFTK